ncbi:MAG: hypothetical protein J07HB67_01234 [halophilic archaeon J07HB67]|jgi:hypothetical protein|nr:MAG: hypothetical protein J07HB67_01234 [halophilic archaeon J07HB67]
MESTGANLSSVAATVSLLVLIVVELASFARDEIDGPEQVVDSRTLFGMDKLDWWPSLGRLVVVHTLNLTILAVATFLVFSVSGQPVSIALLILVVIVGLALPMLEVGEYQAVRDAGVTPASIVLNAITIVTFVLLGVQWPPEVEGVSGISLDNLESVASSFPDGSVSFASLSLVVFISLFFKLVRLEYELKRASESVNNSEATSDSEASSRDENWYP